MSEATLTSLLEYLYGALSPSNQRWLAERLIEHSDTEECEVLTPYTIEELQLPAASLQLKPNKSPTKPISILNNQPTN